MIIDAIGFILGLIIVYHAGARIEHMTARSNHFVRVAHYALSVGGMALVLAPLSKDTWWMTSLGLLLIALGAAALLCFDRRRDQERGGVL